MKRVIIFLIPLLTAMLMSNTYAQGKIAIDWPHGQPTASPTELYPDFRFVLFESSRMPMYDILAEGVSGIVVDVPAGVDALYVKAWGYGPVEVVAPDQSVTGGGYNMCHLDNPVPGLYTVYASSGHNPGQVRIAVGPHFWDVYPPEDYDAIVESHGSRYILFDGECPPHSAYDLARLQQFADEGGGIGIFYDPTDPIAAKPIIRLRDFARKGASIRLDLAAHVFYTLPEPKSLKPLVWEIPPTSVDLELDYEAAFHRPLNFVSRGERPGEFANQSWATARDVKVLRFTKNAGYSIREIGTLTPGSADMAGNGPTLPFMQARDALDAMLRDEARQAGMLEEDIGPFFTKYNWATRLLERTCRSRGVLVVYRLEGEDYDALFPLTTDPLPLERHRVLWVSSILPDAVTGICTVHPAVTAPPLAQTNRSTGVYHEYGFFIETYGGDPLDELDNWGWHFYDGQLSDSGDGEWFHTWGQSPLVPMFSAGVNGLQGSYTSGIVPAAGATEVVISGDEDTFSENPDDPFPSGSYPPVIVARQETAGGRLFGTGDRAFLNDIADNVQFSQNVFEWLCGGVTGGGPDIDIATAVVETSLTAGETGVTPLAVWNIGDAPLALTTTPPQLPWLTATGPTQIDIEPGDTAHYDLQWSAVDQEPGYHATTWVFTSNDSNEPELSWPVRLRVVTEAKSQPPLSGLPSRFELLPAFPNPFNPRTDIVFALPRFGHVSLRVLDLLGREVAVLKDGFVEAGTHRMTFDGSGLASGIYFAQLKAGEFVQTRKLMLLK